MKTTEERIREVQQKHREQVKANREKAKARKARTHRLIVRGAIAEQAIPKAETMTDEDFKSELYRRLAPNHYIIPSPEKNCTETPREDLDSR